MLPSFEPGNENYSLPNQTLIARLIEIAEMDWLGKKKV
jgi:hypothetical protein